MTSQSLFSANLLLANLSVLTMNVHDSAHCVSRQRVAVSGRTRGTSILIICIVTYTGEKTHTRTTILYTFACSPRYGLNQTTI